MAPQPQPSGTPGRERGESRDSPLHAGTCLLPACCTKGFPIPSSAPITSAGVGTAPGQGILPGPEEGWGTSRGWQGTEPARDTSTWQCGHQAQPQQDLRPLARPSPPRRVIYGLCAGRQMAKENRAGGSRRRGAACALQGGEGPFAHSLSRRAGSEPVLVPVPVPGSTSTPATVPAVTSLGTRGQPWWDPPAQEPPHELQSHSHGASAMGHSGT